MIELLYARVERGFLSSKTISGSIGDSENTEGIDASNHSYDNTLFS